MKKLLAALALLCAGCAHYTTPGGAVNLSQIDPPGAERKAVAAFPATLAIARVQAPAYRSYSQSSVSPGRNYSVVTLNELATDRQLAAIRAWPGVKAVVPFSELPTPDNTDNLDNLRATVSQKADVLIVYTVDTAFKVKGRTYDAQATISLGAIPDRDATITSTANANAIFTDARSGFIYGTAKATASSTGSNNFWGSQDSIDRKRVETEQEAFDALITESGKTWELIVSRFGK